MDPDLTRIVLRGGLGELKFGMTPEQVRSLLGLPDGVPLFMSGSESELFWDVADVDLNMTFKNLRGRGLCLVELWTENPRVCLLGIPLVNQSLAATIRRLRDVGVTHRKTLVLDGYNLQFFDRGFELESLHDKV